MGRRPGDQVIYRTRSTQKRGVQQPVQSESRPTRPPAMSGSTRRLIGYAATVAALAIATAGLWPLRQTTGLLNIGLVYLVVIIGVTVFAGQRAGIFASLLGFILLDYFLLPPYLTFSIEGVHNILALFVFLGVSLLISWLIASAREQAQQAEMRAEDISRLYELNQAITGARRVEDVLPAIAQKVYEVFEAQGCWILLPDEHGQLAVKAQAPDGIRALTREETNLANWALRNASEVSSGGQRRLDESGQAAFVPLQTGQKTTGVLAVVGRRNRQPFTTAERKVMATFAGQAAVALERLYLLGEAQRADMLARTDEIKSALMSAVSHDLRTPLASITASVTSLLDPDIQWDDETKRDFLQGIYDEARRLNSLVGNLLDMSRIEGGALHPEKDWYSIGEVIESVIQRVESRRWEHSLSVDIEDNLPLVLLDFTEIAQVLTNLIENAAKHTLPGTAISVQARRTRDYIQVSVLDNGQGVPPEALSQIFEKFYRVDKRSESGSTGLGLAISKGFVEAHGGRISASNRPEGGLKVTFTLPITASPGAESRPTVSGSAKRA